MASSVKIEKGLSYIRPEDTMQVLQSIQPCQTVPVHYIPIYTRAHNTGVHTCICDLVLPLWQFPLLCGSSGTQLGQVGESPKQRRGPPRSLQSSSSATMVPDYCHNRKFFQEAKQFLRGSFQQFTISQFPHHWQVKTKFLKLYCVNQSAFKSHNRHRVQ